MKIARYGWRPDLPDHRDRKFALAPRVVELPEKVDLRKGCPEVYNQLDLGSCTSQAIAAAIQFDELAQGGKTVMPSRLFIYYGERELEGTQDTDSGAMIRDGIKFVNNIGVCPEYEWPYIESKFAIRPPPSCYRDATEKVMLYERLNNGSLDILRGCLAQGLPFVFGFTVYESFESERVGKTGVVELPRKSESVMGGHAVLAIGYDHPSRRFLVRNSWGSSWGQAGNFTIPYEYLTNPDLADDFWVIQRVASVQDSNNPPLPVA